jgi:aminopeptidase N
MQIRLIISVLVLFLFGCNSQKVVVMDEPIIEERLLDTLVVIAPPIEEDNKSYQLPVYNASATQHNDLLHTRLELAFNWEKEQVIGTATLTLKPYFYPASTTTLDAKGFTFNSISLDGQELAYDYDDRHLTIQLPRTYTRDEAYTLVIDYIATPRPDGGSQAITSDKGLFFINPRGETPDKPMQIWTQGETEHNSRWFPTIDKPNERCTQEMYLTVADRFKTLSNGTLVSSTPNEDGTRTDYWKMDQAHAPYLFMLAVGEFAVVEDTPWNGKPVNYYVEPEYEAHAKAIFPHTPEMLDLFSELTGVAYPWAKYSQIVVRDYVSGAMENTTGVIFGEFVQRTERELIDQLINEKIVAHELFHHWFGDYVTCESWANLTLNEGFANYSEYLWLEHKYGRDQADYHLLSEWEGYLGSDMFHDLIYYDYPDKERTFDAHSYNKGGAVLHMLRYILGDDAFFASLEKYLTDNAYSAVEVDELRIAFEDVTGKDLQWFFNQWYLSSGHPHLEISYDYDAVAREAIVRVLQTQDGRKMPPIFQIPTLVDIYLPGQSAATRHAIMVDARQQEFRFGVAQQPEVMVFDPEHTILADWEEDKSDREWIAQFNRAPRFLDRSLALSALTESTLPAVSEVLSAALQDNFWGIRAQALQTFPGERFQPVHYDLIRQMAASDPHAEVRATALTILGIRADAQAVTLAKQALDARSYEVINTGLGVLAELAPRDGLAAASKLENEDSAGVLNGLGKLYTSTGDPKYVDFFAKNLKKVDGYQALSFYDNYAQLVLNSSGESIDNAVKQFAEIATDMAQSDWRRFGATKTLSEIGDSLAEEIDDKQAQQQFERIRTAIEVIKAAETDPQLKGIYEQF